MKVLVLDGSTEPNALGKIGLEAVLEVFDQAGSETEVVHLSEQDIHCCRGCFGCWLETPGKCVINDDAREITRKMIQSDVVVYFTPIVFGGYSHLLKKQVDRSIGLVHPYFDKVGDEHHHRKRYDRYPCIFGVGFQRDRDPELEDLFRTHIQRNALNLHSPSTGAVTLDSEMGSGDIRSAVEDELKLLEVPA
jgi:multimeric flavodoxin WrbA